ncbi:MAG: hypothetical protein NTZ18_00225 [Candidatus Komeilibacteria bacterium]|nr:hypothetical protein [Candidatus Komeilibacteria bacterium]
MKPVKILLISILIFSSLLPLVFIFAQSASNVNDVLKGLDDTAASARIISASKAAPTIYEFIGRFINLFLSFLGVVFMGIIIFAGFTWMFAKGNQEKVQKAHDLLENSFIGLIIIAAAYLLTNYVVFRILDVTLPK